MYLTQREIFKLFKISRTTLLQWEERGIIKEVIKLPGSQHRRYLTSEIYSVLGVSYGG